MVVQMMMLTSTVHSTSLWEGLVFMKWGTLSSCRQATFRPMSSFCHCAIENWKHFSLILQLQNCIVRSGLVIRRNCPFIQIILCSVSPAPAQWQFPMIMALSFLRNEICFLKDGHKMKNGKGTRILKSNTKD